MTSPVVSEAQLRVVMDGMRCLLDAEAMGKVRRCSIITIEDCTTTLALLENVNDKAKLILELFRVGFEWRTIAATWVSRTRRRTASESARRLITFDFRRQSRNESASVPLLQVTTRETQVTGRLPAPLFPPRCPMQVTMPFVRWRWRRRWKWSRSFGRTTRTNRCQRFKPSADRFYPL